MRTVLILIKKEFLQIIRNTLLLRLIVFIPFMMLMIIPYAADLDIKNLNIAVIDGDGSTFSHNLISKLDGNRLFTRFKDIQTKKEADDALLRDKIDLIVEIPSAYERDVQKGVRPTVFVTVNAINGMKAGVGVSYITNVLGDFMSEVNVIYNGPVEMPGRVSLTPIYWFNEKLNFRNIFVPGILTILVTMIGCLLSTINIVREKEIGTIEQLNITPMKKYQFVLGKTIPFWLIGMFEFVVGLMIMRFFFGIHIQGSIVLLLSLTGVYMLAMLGIGFLISIFSRTQAQSMFVIVFIFITFILLSGLFTSVDSMPEWAKAINLVNPVAYFMNIIKLIILKGGTFHNLQTEFISLSVFAVLINALILAFYKREVD